MELKTKIIQDTFEQIKPRADEFATTLYENLFRDYPAIKPLFAGSTLEKQKRLMMAALVQIVHNLENPEFLGEYLGKIGERYADTGWREEHFEWVGLSLLKTLGQLLDKEWTREHKHQWSLAFDVISALMRDGLLRHSPSGRSVDRNVVPLRRLESEQGGTSIQIQITLPRELTEQLDKLAKNLVYQTIQNYFDQAVKREMSENSKRNPQEFLRKVS